MKDISRRLFRAALTAAVIASLLPSACRRGGSAAPSFLRLTDALTAAGVVDSPLKGSTPGEASYPIQSAVMTESGRGEDVLGLKRRVNLGLSDIQILFAPARSEYEIGLPVREAGRLDFGVGLIRDARSASASAGPGAGVNFLIVMESKGRKKVVFEQRLEMPAARDSRTVAYAWHSVPLPRREDDAVLRLITAGTAGAFAFWHAPSFVAPRPSAPNVILISIDTLRPDHLGAYGYGKPTSPAIDALAKDGALFANVYSTTSWTLPAHVSMLTGMNGVRHRVFYEDDRMAPSLPTLADRLRDLGYATHAVTGAGFVSSSYGFAKGFDAYGMNQVEIEDPRSAESAGRDAVDWIEQIGDRPFFLFLHTYQAHSPYKSPDEIRKLFVAPDARWQTFDLSDGLGGRAGVFKPMPDADRDNVIGLYDAGIRAADEGLIKPVLDALKRKALYDRTLIVLTSDHGDEFYTHGGWNHTHSLYNELVRLPLIVKMPDRAFAGKRLDPIVRLIDLMPTVLDVVGAGADPSGIDGRSLLPVLNGGETADRDFQAEFAADVVDVNIPQRVAVGRDGLKLILNQPYSPKEIAFFNSPPRIPPAIELFDVRKDPREQSNLADDPSRAAAVRALLAKAQEVAALVPKRSAGRSKVDPALESQLRALGYIK